MNDNGKCWERACQLIRAGKWESALKICQEEPCSSISVDCQRYVGEYYFKNRDDESALLWFSLSAKNGDPVSLFELACVYNRMGDYSAAFDYFKEAAQKNYPRAYYCIGFSYEYGRGVEKNRQLAITYLQKAADHGYFIAKRALNQFEYQSGNLFVKIKMKLKLVVMLYRVFLVARNDTDDERLSDILSSSKFLKNIVDKL